jgi:general secretion pathway protein D
MSTLRSPRHAPAWLCMVLLTLLLGAGCASTTAREEANALARAGDLPQALARLDQAVLESPSNASLRATRDRLRERLALQQFAQVEQARAAGQLDAADAALTRARATAPDHARGVELQRQLDNARRQARQLAQARQDVLTARAAAPGGKGTQLAMAVVAAEAVAQQVLAEQPGHPGALALMQQAQELSPRLPAAPPAMAAAFQKPVSLEFRDAPLRQVFEALARSTDINFVFDKDVRGDQRITVFLRQVSLDEALRIILATQQLDRKLLNERTVLVFPNTQGKQREHQELVTRSLYLKNADPKQTLQMVRAITKTRDAHVDDRLNLLIIRDTPEVVHLVEQLIESIDLPEPEVVMEVQVLEVSSDQLDELGLSWPTQVRLGLPDVIGQVPLSQRGNFIWSIANPALVATLVGNSGTANLLANPSIRARNREKGKVYIGEKLPVFTTTSTANVGVSTSVSYLDIGLKLDIEPSVQLDNEVILKVALEVSSLIGEVRGPQGSLAYNVGTRVTSTSLRLKDGETQVLAGLISDEDRRSAVGVPGIYKLPIVGKLFGVQTDSRKKSEIIMLITPHIVRNLPLPSARYTTLAAGTDALPGARTVRLASQGSASVATGAGGAAAGPASAPEPPAPNDDNVLLLSSSEEAQPGETVSVTLASRAATGVRGELVYDASVLQPAQASVGASAAGRVAFELGPRGDLVLVFRVLPAGAGTVSDVSVNNLQATDAAADGEVGNMRIEGAARITIRAAAPVDAATGGRK